MKGFDLGALLFARAELEPLEPWTDRDRPDPVLDAAYRGGIVPPERRIEGDFTYKPAPAEGKK
jgi:hypothetical protein